MNQNSNNNTQKANWDFLFPIMNIVIFLLIIIFGYLLMKDQIDTYFNESEYTEQQQKDFRRARRHNSNQNMDKIENGIHVKTGLADDPNLQVIIGSCTSCHSAKLITQNSDTRDGWKQIIRWMQKSQNLPDLGSNEPIILDYLAKYYAPKEEGRRPNLDIESIKWYVLQQ